MTSGIATKLPKPGFVGFGISYLGVIWVIWVAMDAGKVKASRALVAVLTMMGSLKVVY